eukprot:PhM_4_TR8435/c0_g1_i1/m.4105
MSAERSTTPTLTPELFFQRQAHTFFSVLRDADSGFLPDLPASTSAFSDYWWKFIEEADQASSARIALAKQKAHEYRGLLGIAVDGGTIKDMSCHATFITLYAGDAVFPLPALIFRDHDGQFKRGKVETADAIFKAIKE